MICYVMLAVGAIVRYDMLCYVMICYVMLAVGAIVGYDMLCYVMLCWLCSVNTE